MTRLHGLSRRACSMLAPLLIALLLSTHAGTTRAEGEAAEQQLRCINAAAAYHEVNPWVLKAIIFHESRGNALAINHNRDGSVDLGLGQLNSVHLPELARYGVTRELLLDGCTNTYVTAWHLAKQVRQYGNTWLAVGTYHSRTPANRDRYAAQIYRVLQSWNTLPK